MHTAKATDFFVSGGTLPLDSASYIERDCDRSLFDALSAGKYCYVLNTRQMGKSSLSVRILARLEAAGWECASIDLTQMGGRNVTAEQWYTGLASEVGRSFRLRSEMLAYFREHSQDGPMKRFFGALRDVILEKTDRQIAICIDEVDATRNLAFDTDEFFAGIRECYNHRVQDSAFQRLTFCLIGVAVASDLIRNQTTTPFNIGERVYLSDFTLAELRTLEKPFGPRGREVVERIHYWAQGHPFLSQSLCAAVLAGGEVLSSAQVDALVHATYFGPKARERNVNLADVANRALNGGAGDADPERFRADLLSTYERVLRGKFVPDDEANRIASVLKLSGLVRSDGARLIVRNRIYARVFDRAWIREHLPGQELIRQQQSFRRGLLRATIVCGAILATVGTLGIIAWQSRTEAVSAQHKLDRALYVADMNNLWAFEEDGDIAEIANVLEETRNSPYRGFEWGYWMNRLHDSAEEYTLDYFAPGKREKGILSWDGKQICIVDDVTLSATVVERSTKKVLVIRSLKNREEVVSAKSGYVVVDYASSPAVVTGLVTGNRISTLGNPKYDVDVLPARPHGTGVLTRQPLEQDPQTSVVQLWDLATGKLRFSYPEYHQINNQLIVYSAENERVTVCHRAYGASKNTPMTLTVYDADTGAVIDESLATPTATLFDISDSGRYLLYTDGASNVVVRDIDAHAVVYRRAWISGETPTGVSLADDDRVLSILDSTGKASLEEFPSGRSLGVRYNVWSISPAVHGSDLVASATSVRVFDLKRPATASVIETGFRIGRDGLGHIVVLRDENPQQLLRLSDPDLTVEQPTTLGSQHYNLTYNGRWAMSVNRKDHSATLIGLSDRIGPIRLQPAPANFSGGLSPDIFCLYQERTGQIIGISGKDGLQLWSYRMMNPQSNGIWMSPDSQNVLAFSKHMAVTVLDARTGKVRGTIFPHNLRISNITFTADGKGFFTFGADGRAVLWDLSDLKERMEFRGNAGQRVTGADLSPDGRRVVTTTEGGTWRVWDAQTGQQLTNVSASTGPIRGVLFTKDGKKLLTVGLDRTVRVWPSLDADPAMRIKIKASLLTGIKR